MYEPHQTVRSNRIQFLLAGTDGCDGCVIHDPAIVFIHFLVAIARQMHPGGARSVVAESLLVKHKLVIVNRGLERVPEF